MLLVPIVPNKPVINALLFERQLAAPKCKIAWVISKPNVDIRGCARIGHAGALLGRRRARQAFPLRPARTGPPTGRSSFCGSFHTSREYVRPFRVHHVFHPLAHALDACVGRNAVTDEQVAGRAAAGGVRQSVEAGGQGTLLSCTILFIPRSY